MSTPYEVEHNVLPGETGVRAPNRRVDMSSFFSFLSQITTEPAPGSLETERHHNPHAQANPVDTANLLRLLQDQFATLLADSPSADNRTFLQALIQEIDADVSDLPALHGVSQDFIDNLDRVSKKALVGPRGQEQCAICACKFTDDPHPLVVELPCNPHHCFDLECIAPWLRSRGTCPMCRRDFVKKKEQVQIEDSEEEYDDMYA